MRNKKSNHGTLVFVSPFSSQTLWITSTWKRLWGFFLLNPVMILLSAYALKEWIQGDFGPLRSDLISHSGDLGLIFGILFFVVAGATAEAFKRTRSRKEPKVWVVYVASTLMTVLILGGLFFVVQRRFNSRVGGIIPNVAVGGDSEGALIGTLPRPDASPSPRTAQ